MAYRVLVIIEEIEDIMISNSPFSLCFHVSNAEVCIIYVAYQNRKKVQITLD